MAEEASRRTPGGQAAGRTAEQESTFAEEMAALVQREVEQVTRSLRDEVEALRRDVAERAREAGRGAAFLGGAGGLGLVAAGAVASLPILGLRKLVPGWAVALLVATGAGSGAVYLALKGLELLEAAAPDAVAGRIEQAKDDISDALKQRAATETAPSEQAPPT